MVSPSYEDRICTMFDSFSKIVSRNYYRDLLRAEERRNKHYTEEPVEYLLELLGHRDTYPSDSFVLYAEGNPVWRAKRYLKHFYPCRTSSGRSYCLTFGTLERMGKLQPEWR